MFGSEMRRPQFQLFAGAGFGVIFLNPRGSTGYGQEFARGCVQDWGGGDYRDLMAGVDAAMAEHAWIDGDRLGVCGGSYGGFMTSQRGRWCHFASRGRRFCLSVG